MVSLHGEYLNAKYHKYPCITSKDIANQRIPKSDWIRAFWHITCEAEFSQIQSLHWKTDTCKPFHFMLLPPKYNNKIA